MSPINALLDAIRDVVRAVVRRIAKVVNVLSGGRLHPNAVTLTALVAHLPIVWLLADQRYTLAAILLVILGLFDALDGALARLQGRVSRLGMLLDSVTDRMKEVLIHVGIAVALVNSGRPDMVVWAVAACGASLLVSYVNAWGEAVIAGSKLAADHKVNQSFRNGLMSFDVRMTVVIIGLASEQISDALVVIAVLAALTAIERLIHISKLLKHVQD